MSTPSFSSHPPTLIMACIPLCCLVYNGQPGGLGMGLKRLMNCFIWFIFRAPSWSHLCTELNWLYADFQLQSFRYIIYFYQSFKTQKPPYILDLFTLWSSFQSLNTRFQPINLCINLCKKTNIIVTYLLFYCTHLYCAQVQISKYTNFCLYMIHYLQLFMLPHNL